MQRIVVSDLTEEEKLLIELSQFEFTSIDNALTQFMSTNSYEYNDDHVNKIVEIHSDKFIRRQLIINKVVNARGIGNNIVEWQYGDGSLVVTI